MKIRMGFVTNSSSSSFIVAFDKEINTLADATDVINALIGKHGIAGVEYGLVSSFIDTLPHSIDKQVMINALARKLHECISHGRRVTSSDGDFETAEDYYDSYYRGDGDLSFREKLERLIATNKDRCIYEFEVSDDTAIGSCLEHGDLLRKLPHIIVSLH